MKAIYRTKLVFILSLCVLSVQAQIKNSIVFDREEDGVLAIQTYQEVEEVNLAAGLIVLQPTEGKVSIGTRLTSGEYLLNVNGVIHAKGVHVDLTLPAPDYVFEDSYPLMSLAAIEQYIQANKHLPNIPSGNSLMKDGVNLIEMNMKLLEKVEELTLHLIEQDKELKRIKTLVDK